MSVALFPAIVGTAFETLPADVKALHGDLGERTWSGKADITRGRNMLANLIATLSGLPPAGEDVPVTVTLTPKAVHNTPPSAPVSEVWTRNFGGSIFRSTLSERGGLLRERVGIVELSFTLTVRDATVIDWRLCGVRVLGIPLPKVLHPRVVSESFADDKTYRFNIAAELPMLGTLVTYRGWLLPGTTTDKAQQRALEATQ